MPIVTRAPLFGVIGPQGIPSTNQILWLKADAISASDQDLIATWPDSSPSGNDATQGTGTNKPTFYTEAISTEPALYFEGTDNFMSLTSGITATGNLTVFVVWKRLTTSPGRFLFGGAAASDGLGMLIQEPALDGITQVASSDLASTLSGTVAVHNGGWNCSSFTKTSGDFYEFRVNFASAGSGTGIGDLATPGPITTIGSIESAASRFWLGFIAEIIIYDAVLSAGQISVIESYLQNKYGGVIGQVRLLWLEGDAITGKSDGDDMTRWVDSSGQGVRVTVPTPGNVKYKTNLQNSLPGVRFDTNNASGFITNLYMANQGEFTIYAVYNYKSATSAARRAVRGSSLNWLMGPYSNIHRIFGGTGFSTGLAVTQDVFVAQWGVFSGGNTTNYVNEVAYTDATNGPPGAFLALSSPDLTEPLNGDILEIVVENRADDSTQQSDMYDYLQAKYAL